MISRYMVLVVSEQKLLMMRLYQIYAVKAIVECIHQKTGNGYILHTTGRGKTLTSFKASTLLKDNHDIDKCLFVVDRKDLDRQTREEFNKFQEGCVEENTNTETMVRRLLSDDYAGKVIVTTIQKLGLALDGAPPIETTDGRKRSAQAIRAGGVKGSKPNGHDSTRGMGCSPLARRRNVGTSYATICLRSLSMAPAIAPNTGLDLLPLIKSE